MGYPASINDSNAIMVVCCGEFFGTVGYVGREYASEVKTILDNCTAYRVDILIEEEIGKREMHLLVTWKPKKVP